MNVQCKKCLYNFILSQHDRERSDLLFKSKGITKIFVDCPGCGTEIRVDRIDKKKSAINLRCPVSHCSGWVDYIESGFERSPFWGCGECGSRWIDKMNLFKEIVEITKRYPYRKKCYSKISIQECIPADLKKEGNGYEDRVNCEADDTQCTTDFFRG